MSSRSTFRKPVNLLHPPSNKSYRTPVSSQMLVRRRNMMNAMRRKAEFNRTMKITKEGAYYWGNMLSALEDKPKVKFTMPARMNLALKRLGRKKTATKKKPVRK